MKSFNRYNEDTMKSFNRYAALSLRTVLAAAVVTFGVSRSNDYLSRAEPSALAAVGPKLFAAAGGVFLSIDQGENWMAVNAGLTNL
jgi:hypothetical protein